MKRIGIKPKMGVCPDCDTDTVKPVIAGKCRYHYWQPKRSEIARQAKPIAKRSSKMRKADSVYTKKKAAYMSDHPVCEVRGCGNRSTDLHHKKGRGIHYTDETYFMAVCRPCHNRFDTDTAWAMSEGYVISRLSND